MVGLNEIINVLQLAQCPAHKEYSIEEGYRFSNNWNQLNMAWTSLGVGSKSPGPGSVEEEATGFSEFLVPTSHLGGMLKSRF